MTSAAPTLVLVRHAQAEQFATEDEARVLTERGRRDAVEAGAWLAARSLVPDHALVSSAVRARQTWEALRESLPDAAEPLIEESLHSASPDTALEAVRASPADARCVLVVGHNPTIASLATALDDGSPEPEAFRAMSEGYPPAALTVLEVPVPWADLAEGTAHIAGFHVGEG